MKTVTTQQLAEELRQTETTIVDVRSPDKFAHNHVEHNNATVKNVPKNVIFAGEHADSLEVPFSKQDKIVLTCATGNSATRCAHILADKGYDVRVLAGGMTAWNKSYK